MLDSDKRTAMLNALRQSVSARTATVGVIGLGYVGLPLGVAIAQAGFPTVGFDVDPGKVEEINAGNSYIYAVTSERLAGLVAGKRLRATEDFAELASCDIIVICVPTPLTHNREPDLSYVAGTARTIAENLRRGQLIVLESTTYPGTTTEVIKPILEEETGLKSGTDFYLGYSPEREDPGNSKFATAAIPKVVSGEGEDAKELAASFYAAVVSKVVPVSSTQVAEAVKLTENIFRAVNIALVNELKVIYAAMGIDVWEVIDAAATKPFGYMPFYPGPGLGGHCIPIDPFYLTWKSREHEVATRFIELAGEINLSMPRHVVDAVQDALNHRFSLPLNNARILILGLAYKKNVADVRESPSLKLIKLFEQRGATVGFHDPHVAEIPPMREYPQFKGRKSVHLDGATVASQHAVVVATDHDAIDYALVAAHARFVVDTRNVFARKGLAGDHIIKA
jgi:UDP-N-acetyl-D-glucosamine dehydrogenase